MSPNVTSLELSKKLSLAYPDVKTEYVYSEDINRGEIAVCDRYNIVFGECLIDSNYRTICSTFDIEELFELLPARIKTRDMEGQLTVRKTNFDSDTYFVLYQIHETTTPIPNAIYSDVSLVEALSKLAVWRAEQ